MKSESASPSSPSPSPSPWPARSCDTHCLATGNAGDAGDLAFSFPFTFGIPRPRYSCSVSKIKTTAALAALNPGKHKRKQLNLKVWKEYFCWRNTQDMQRNDLENGNLTHLGTAPLRLHLHIKLRVFVLKVRLVWFLRLLAHAPLALECCSSNQTYSVAGLSLVNVVSPAPGRRLSLLHFLCSWDPCPSWTCLVSNSIHVGIHSCREELALSIKSSCSLPHPLLWFPVIGSVHSTGFWFKTENSANIHLASFWHLDLHRKSIFPTSSTVLDIAHQECN